MTIKKQNGGGGYGLSGGVADGTRTHDNRNHNPGLYQLSYSHHMKKSDTVLHTQTELNNSVHP